MPALMSQGDPSLEDTRPHSPAAADPPSPAPTSVKGATFDALVGTILADRYQIIRKVGEGGMGAVYEARHTVIGKRVALKVLLDKFLENQELIARLLQEARLASSIGHEHIVDVTDFGTTGDGRAFVVMEFLEGESLAQLVIRDAPLPVERSLRIVRQVASALAAAHAKGIVHRDIKPENIYLVRRGDADFVKVVDFGVSKAVRSCEEGAGWDRLTRTGMVLGTPLYMSPEQARGGDDVDHRADIWATGLMLYECLTGEVPFRANNYLGVISQVLTQETVPPSQLRPELGIPAAVDRVVMHALDKNRERRYQDIATLEQDLDRLIAGDPTVGLQEVAPTATAQVSPLGRLRWPLVAGLLIAAGASIGVVLARNGAEPPDTLPARPVLPKVNPATPAPRPAAVAPAEPAPAEPAPAEPDRTRRTSRPKTARTPAATPTPPATATATQSKKSKADDAIAPSPYRGTENP
jgi:serine/threonine-protein kinase